MSEESKRLEETPETQGGEAPETEPKADAEAPKDEKKPKKRGKKNGKRERMKSVASYIRNTLKGNISSTTEVVLSMTWPSMALSTGPTNSHYGR